MMSLHTLIYDKEGVDVPTHVDNAIIGPSVAAIAIRAFYYCRNLSSVTLGDSLTVIRQAAFYNCYSLVIINIPASLNSIGGEAFFNCTSLVTVNMSIQGSLANIGERAFFNCSRLVTITIPEAVTVIEEATFWGCSSLVSIILPESLNIIEKNAFKGCSNLVTVNLPPSLSNMCEGAFALCHSLVTITMPESLITIGNYPFAKCDSLASMTIHSSLDSISSTIFADCTALATINAPSFPTTTIENNPTSFQRALIEAGFSPRDPVLVLSGEAHSSHLYDNDIHYNARKWAKTRDSVGRLPLCIAADRSLEWLDVQSIFAVNMPAIEEKDILTGLQLFMLAAVGLDSKLESIYQLLRAFPSTIGSSSSWLNTPSSDCIRKRGNQFDDCTNEKIPRLLM